MELQEACWIGWNCNWARGSVLIGQNRSWAAGMEALGRAINREIIGWAMRAGLCALGLTISRKRFSWAMHAGFKILSEKESERIWKGPKKRPSKLAILFALAKKNLVLQKFKQRENMTVKIICNHKLQPLIGEMCNYSLNKSTQGCYKAMEKTITGNNTRHEEHEIYVEA
ncbi:hypothetical protein M9H77_09632 [Catharanthus roseus]|uniref:Uncharacterized protein n=1 Tax=Catharanthus roseus TaxID=4058 RepID=A0ACC0C155_CATRO|nr:hypothetical protein M9H77_09632 [Catharanthus roseus]